jgi:hypothetical protein
MFTESNQMCASGRRKIRADVLKARRNVPAKMNGGMELISNMNFSSSIKAEHIEALVNVNIIEDKRIIRKLRNRASALVSRNKKTEEIESLTYQLGEDSYQLLQIFIFLYILYSMSSNI